jgi:hypothetical protein
MSKIFNDMYLIAALVAYGFEPEEIDDSNKNRQKYRFSSEDVRKVFTLQPDGRSRWDMLDVKAVEQAYSSEKLLFPPNYPHTLRTVKYSIISKKHEDEPEYDN